MTLTSDEYRKYLRDNRYRRINKYKISKGCIDCGYNKHPKALCFDHKVREDKTILLDASKDELEKLYTFLSKNKLLNIEIYGHTDNQGSEVRNNELSLQRANAVSEFLISKGIEANRIKSFGYGSTKPISNNDSEEGRAKNRRVEFKLLKTKIDQC